MSVHKYIMQKESVHDSNDKDSDGMSGQIMRTLRQVRPLSKDIGERIKVSLPLGCTKSPLSTPDLIARLNWLSKAAPGETFGLLERTYFFRCARLERVKIQQELVKVGAEIER